MAIDLKAIEQLATDQASLKAAAGLTKPGKWSGAGRSSDGALIWGECAGSGANPYRVMADLRDLGNKCTCPSRKFPCKHVLGLLWIHVEAAVAFPPGETPDWVTEWLGRRRATAAAPRPGAAATDKDVRAARRAEPEPVEDAAPTARREAAAARRAEDTHQTILAALEALEQWVGDQLRLGLGGFIDDAPARCRRIGARLVDGKAAALAGHVDELPGRLLAAPSGDRIRHAAVELSRLVLLARAYRADPGRAEVRRAIASAENRDALLDNPATMRVASAWEVLAEQVRTRRDGLVAQTTWLLNLGDGPRFAMLRDFFPASAGRRGAAFTSGEQFLGELAFYPAAAPLRAILIGREAAAIDAPPVPWPAPAAPLTDTLTAALLAEPWAPEWPVLLPAGRIGFDQAGAPWWRPRDADAGIALAVANDCNDLLAGTDLSQAAALWSSNRLELLAGQTAWGRVRHG